MAWAADRRVRQWLALGGFAAAVVVYNGLTEWSRNHALMINQTESLPNWAFWVQRDRDPDLGQYVFFTPPANSVVRAYFGEKPVPFGKRVLGVAGDLVTHDGPLVRVNGRAVARIKPRSRRGDRLAPGPVGIIPRGCYYVGTDHPDGFDSRYAAIGFVCSRQVFGTGTPIL